MTPGGSPRVSIVIAARDDAERLEATLRGCVAQRGVALEVIVVDDRSMDDTPALLRAWMRRDPRVRGLRVDTLPEGWLGKNHACQAGAETARGEWLLFCDADVRLDAEAVRDAIDTAEGEGHEHLAIAPETPGRSFWGRVAVLHFISYGVVAAEAARRGRPVSVGAGAFNLVRRETFERFGGWTDAPLEILDDLEVGRRVRRVGGRTRMLAGTGRVAADWALGPLGLVQATEKNFFAALRFSEARVAIVVAVHVLAWAGTLTAPWWAGSIGWLTLLAWVATSTGTWSGARRLRAWPGEVTSEPRTGGHADPLVAACAPLGGVILVAAVVNSAVKTLVRGEIRWRGTAYPLAALRAAQRRSRRGEPANALPPLARALDAVR